MSVSRRRSTVHDAAALRLHPNGVRVALAPAASSQVRNPTSTAITKKTKRPLLDTRGNWIASDAAGDARVTKRLRLEKGGGEADGVVPMKMKKYKDARANRRMAFENNLDFLDGPIPVQGLASEELRPQPFSEFLKCIHYFASQHYAASGQPFDSAAQYRKDKKEKRRLRARLEDSQSPGEGVTTEEKTRQEVSAHEDPNDITRKLQEARSWKTTMKAEHTRKDMYKAFDGSALLCIGMLLRSYIGSQLADRRPIDWQDDLSQNNVSAPEDESDNDDLSRES